MLVSIAAILVSIAYPSQAQALEIERWTAQSNQDAHDFLEAPNAPYFQGQMAKVNRGRALLEMPEGSKFPEA